MSKTASGYKGKVITVEDIFLKDHAISTLLYGCHARRPARLEITKKKTSAIYKHFLRWMIKNGSKWINPIDLKEDNPSSDIIDWPYRIIKNVAK